MRFQPKCFHGLLVLSFVLLVTVAWQGVVAEDAVHAVSGVVKSIDKTSKTMVVKAGDGTEHTVKWTEKTSVKGAKDTGKGTEAATMDSYDGLKEGSKVTVKYTEKGGEKTAVAVKDASKATAKALAQ